MAEFRRLGAEVVFGEFGRLCASGRRRRADECQLPEDEQAFVERCLRLRELQWVASTASALTHAVVASVNARELYKYLQLTVVNHWELLVWMDPANFAGVICEDPTVDFDATVKPAIDMQWNLGTFLSPAIQSDFTAAVGSFVLGMLQCRGEAYANGRTPLRIIQSATQTQADPAHKQQSELVANFVKSKLQRQMLKVIQDIDSRHRDAQPHEDLRREWEFPVLPGALNAMSNPILEFIKSICAVFALVKEAQNEVGIMRRHMLELIGVKECVAGVELSLIRVIGSLKSQSSRIQLCRSASASSAISARPFVRSTSLAIPIYWPELVNRELKLPPRSAAGHVLAAVILTIDLLSKRL